MSNPNPVSARRYAPVNLFCKFSNSASNMVHDPPDVRRRFLLDNSESARLNLALEKCPCQHKSGKPQATERRWFRQFLSPLPISFDPQGSNVYRASLPLSLWCTMIAYMEELVLPLESNLMSLLEHRRTRSDLITLVLHVAGVIHSIGIWK